MELNQYQIPQNNNECSQRHITCSQRQILEEEIKNLEENVNHEKNVNQIMEVANTVERGKHCRSMSLRMRMFTGMLMIHKY